LGQETLEERVVAAKTQKSEAKIKKKVQGVAGVKTEKRGIGTGWLWSWLPLKNLKMTGGKKGRGLELR